MQTIDLKDIPCPNLGNGNQDTFEFFARDFFESLGFTILEEPSRGPDEGRDLVIAESLSGIHTQIQKRWLVSCKHFAHSGKSVSHNIEKDINGRVDTHGCTGFIAFYSTLPSSGLRNNLEKLKNKFSIEVYDKARIEKILESDNRMKYILRKYFPSRNITKISDYTWEKLFVTILILASGDSDAKERLIDAYCSSLIRLNPSDFPSNLQGELIQITTRLTLCESRNSREGRVRATVSQMEERDVKDIIEKIVSLYDRYIENHLDHSD